MLQAAKNSYTAISQLKPRIVIKINLKGSEDDARTRGPTHDSNHSWADQHKDATQTKIAKNVRNTYLLLVTCKCQALEAGRFKCLTRCADQVGS